ncbi:MAG: YbjN domain-containing protein [Myxococcales bacterium]|nr:YbjN domain-containing protein [Myxococcales bacterium]
MDPLDQVIAWCGRAGVEAARVDEDTLVVPIETSAGRMTGIVAARRDMSILLFYAVGPERVPPERRAAVAEYMTRANFGLPMGCFEMDWEDGEVRYRTALDYEGTSLAPVQIDNLVQPAIHVSDRYLPALLQVARGELEPEAAIAEAEAG